MSKQFMKKKGSLCKKQHRMKEIMYSQFVQAEQFYPSLKNARRGNAMRISHQKEKEELQ
jgi:hypothetical protein